MHSELERVWYEESMTYVKVGLSLGHFEGLTEEPATPRKQVRSINN
jgi:hypothetical protein